MTTIRTQLEDSGHAVILTAAIQGLKSEALTFYQNLPFEFNDNSERIKAMVETFSKQYPAPPESVFTCKKISQDLRSFDKYPGWYISFDKAISEMGLKEEWKAPILLARIIPACPGRNPIRLYSMSYGDLH